MARDHNPSGISHVRHNAPTLSGLKYNYVDSSCWWLSSYSVQEQHHTTLVTLTKCCQALERHISCTTWRTYSKVYADSCYVVETSHSILNQRWISHKHAQLSVNMFKSAILMLYVHKGLKMVIIKHAQVNMGFNE